MEYPVNFRGIKIIIFFKKKRNYKFRLAEATLKSDLFILVPRTRFELAHSCEHQPLRALKIFQNIREHLKALEKLSI